MATDQRFPVEVRRRAAEAIALDLLTFVEDVANFYGNTDLQIRARVLIAQVDSEEKRVVAHARDEAFCGEHRVPISTCGCPLVLENTYVRG